MVIREVYKHIFRKWGDKPSELLVDISGSCNLRCWMCSLPENFTDKGIMPLTTFKKLEGVLGNLRSISLACNCEPLMNKNVVEFVRYVKSVNRDIRVGFPTNATLLTPELIYGLLDAGLNWINISLDGATKETYEKIRLGASFENVIDNIKGLVARRTSMKNELKSIGLVAVACKLNIDELMDILDLAKKLGVDSLKVNGLVAHRKDAVSGLLSVPFYKNPDQKYENIFSRLHEKASEYNINLSLPMLRASPFGACDFKTCVISWNGDVSPCYLLSYDRPYYYFEKESFLHKLCFGNINSTEFMDIWNSGRYRDFRKRLRSGNLICDCLDCPLQQKLL